MPVNYYILLMLKNGVFCIKIIHINEDMMNTNESGKYNITEPSALINSDFVL